MVSSQQPVCRRFVPGIGVRVQAIELQIDQQILPWHGASQSGHRRPAAAPFGAGCWPRAPEPRWSGSRSRQPLGRGFGSSVSPIHPNSRIRDHGRVTTSPPLRVIRARKTSWLTEVLINRTDPSASRALKPPGWDEPAPKSDLAAAGSKGTSSGLVQGTACLASTTINVLDSAVGDLGKLRALASFKKRSLAHESLIGRGKRLDRRSTRAQVRLRHLLEERLVVRAVPGLVELELLIERCLTRYRAEWPPASSEGLCPACR